MHGKTTIKETICFTGSHFYARIKHKITTAMARNSGLCCRKLQWIWGFCNEQAAILFQYSFLMQGKKKLMFIHFVANVYKKDNNTQFVIHNSIFICRFNVYCIFLPYFWISSGNIQGMYGSYMFRSLMDHHQGAYDGTLLKLQSL